MAAKHFCNRGYCAKAAADGEACYKNNGCLTGVCTSGKCGLPTARALGAACSASTQCQSGYCGRSICRAPEPKTGAYCYKDAGCVSKKCLHNKCSAGGATTSTVTAPTTTAKAGATTTAKTGATTTATSTTSTAASPGKTFPVTDPPPAPASPITANGDFSNGKLAPYTYTAKGAGSIASVEKINGNYVAALKAGPGGSVSITRPIDTTAKSLQVRDAAKNWQLQGYDKISEFSKDSTAAPYAVCRELVTVGGVTTNLYEWVYEYAVDGAYDGGWGTLQHRWPRGPTDFTITMECDPGMSGKLLLDNIQVGPWLHTYPPYKLDDGDFESSTRTLAPEWYVANPDTTDRAEGTIKKDASLAQHGSQYFEIDVDSTWYPVIYHLDQDPPYERDDDTDPDRKNLTWDFWYNFVSIESTNGDASTRDGCYFSAGRNEYTRFFGAAGGAQYVQVNDKSLSLPTGWKKASLEIPLRYGDLELELYCKQGVHGVVRIDNLQLTVPQNETAY